MSPDDQHGKEPEQEPEVYEETVEINTLLGKGSRFEGKLTFEGTVRIDGELTGEVFSDDILVVGEGGLLKADVEIGSLVIEGSVEGNIHAKRSVEIHSPGQVRGNIVTPSLFIDRGVVFEGNCQMYDDSSPGEQQGIVAAPPTEQNQEITDRSGQIEGS